MKKIKSYFIDMISDTSGHINSKIVLGFISFIIATVLALLKYDTVYVGMFLAFSGSCFGFSCFDNNSAFKFNRQETKTETINKDTKLDVAETIKNIKKKK